MNPATIPDMPSVLFTGYGPLAFGAVLLLGIWRAIVKPELDRINAQRAADLEAFGQVFQTSLALKDAAESIKTTALTLAARLEAMEARSSNGSASK